MKVALLLCDHVQVELQDEFGDYPEIYRRWLPWAEFSVFDLTQSEFPQIEDHDNFLVTGSRSSVYDGMKWIFDLEKMVREIQQLNKKYVGICFGHQMLAQALGGQVQKDDNGWVLGVHTFTASNEASLNHAPLRSFNVLMSCQDQVQKLPVGAKLLATAQACVIGSFQMGENMLGIQGHPEFSKDYFSALLQLRKDGIDHSKVDHAQQSLQEHTDSKSLSNWIEIFFRGAEKS